MVRLPDAAGQVRNAPVKALRGFFAGIGQLLLAADRFREEEAERERTGDEEQHDPLTSREGQPASRDLPPGQAAGETAAAGGAAAAGGTAGRTRDRGGRDAQPAGPRRFRSLDSTGNVRVLTPAETAKVPPEPAAPPKPGASPQAGVAPEAVQPEAVQAAPVQPELRGSDAAPGTGQPAVPAVPAARTAPRVAAAVGRATSARQPGSAGPAPTARPARAAAQAPAAASLPVPGYDGLSLPSLRSRLRVLTVAQLRILVDYERSTANRQDIVTMFERRIAKLEAAGPDAT